jgi:hypothetical protein
LLVINESAGLPVGWKPCSAFCLAEAFETWQIIQVTRQHHKFWLLILGILAMLSSMMSVTLVGRMAGPLQQMVQSSVSHATAIVVPTLSHAAAMPCHKQTKPAPRCPKSICPDIAICLAKCVQQAPALLALDAVPAMIMQRIGWPAPDQIFAGSLIPPLLRPPSV